MIDKIARIYFTLLPFTVFLLSFTNLVDHGRVKEGISKNYFIYLYIFSLVFNIVIGSLNFYLIHVIRRIFECLIFRYQSSKMSFLHLIHGFIYYLFLSIHLRHAKNISLHIFICLNLFHFLTHYTVFKMRKYSYSHYLGEFLIYFYLYRTLKSIELLCNIFYLIIFILVSVRKRRLYKKS
jgi:hypothetical protein